MIEYTTNTDPEDTGVYACRVPDQYGLLEDRFLVWITGEQRWFYPSSDQRYRGKVLGWVGPLRRRFK